jgi:hypothetical protein
MALGGRALRAFPARVGFREVIDPARVQWLAAIDLSNRRYEGHEKQATGNSKTLSISLFGFE